MKQESNVTTGVKFTSSVSFYILLTFSALAQSTVSTAVVGFQSTTINSSGLAVLSAPFADAVVSASVSAASTNTITLSQSNLGSLFTGTDPLYLEVTTGASAGERYDLNTSGITSATDTLTINTTSANNTSAYNGSALIGSTVAVRKHTTLSAIRNWFSPALKTGTSSTADLVYIFSAGNWTPYWLNSSSIWTRSGSPNNQGALVIPPGTAFMFKRVDTTATVFTTTGTVRGNRFAKNYRAGLGIYAAGFPVAYSPSTMGATTAGGWANGDVIFVLSSGSFTPYTYNGSNWKRAGNPVSNFDTTSLLASDSGILVRKATATSVAENSPVN